MSRHPLRHRPSGSLGQALVEFSLAFGVFVVLMMGVLDFGVAIYKYNGVSQAAREIARVASVHQGDSFSSGQITAVEATQQGLIPGLSVSSVTCTNINGAAVAFVTNTKTGDQECPATAFVNVTVTAPYKAVTPVLGLLGTWTMTGSSSAQIQ